MANPTGEAGDRPLRLDFDRRVKLEFHGSRITCDAGLLAYRELDDALGLSAMAAEVLADLRTGRNGRHALVGLLRQSVFGRLAGYEDVNGAERLRHDPAMRWIRAHHQQRRRSATVSSQPPVKQTILPAHALGLSMWISNTSRNRAGSQAQTSLTTPRGCPPAIHDRGQIRRYGRS
jgi:hypothetical protein